MQMRRFWNWRTLAFSALVALPLTVVIAASARPVLAVDKGEAGADGGGDHWDRAAAARYLDGREIWWQSWETADKDRGTLCVSCHTQAPYALVRPTLRRALGEAAPTAAEKVMLASVEKRVTHWRQMQPFYSDLNSGPGKEVESRNAEAVLNAVILNGYDVDQGKLGENTRLAFANAWALQTKDGPDAGAWVWQNFKYAPWESVESQYHWAALMAVAVGKAPDRYRADPAVAQNLAALTGYLRSHYGAQPLLNQIAALWASVAFPDVLDGPERARLLATLARLQRPDGGWSLSDLGPWARVDKTPLETGSDGYATGLVVLVLEETGENAKTDAHLGRGVAWLRSNQDRKTGAWPAWSLNKNRDLTSDVGKFMSDAATGYAVLALEKSR
jgi:squalene-hopene/tetraprenyl-beta-curcumene cyclase